MKIVACVKIVPDEEWIQVLPSRELAMDNTPWKISQYDLNALEAGKKLAAETAGTMTALSVGCKAALEPTKIRKDVLSRGADDLAVVMDDSRDYGDSLQTAKALASALKEMGDAQLVLCGTGSSDLYAQEVGIQVGALLDWPSVNNVTNITVKGDVLEVERTLEEGIEILEVALPCVLSVSSEINNPAVPAMRDIMRAGKKPVNAVAPALDDATASLAMLEQVAPQQAERRQQVVEGDGEEAVDALLAFLKKEVL